MTLPVDPSLYLAYLGVMAAMALFPGPSNLFCVATGMGRGPRSALAAAAGMNAATLVWYAAAALGLGALIAAFPGLFRLIRLAGAAYLAWLAVQALRGGLSDQAPDAIAGPRTASAFRDGFAVQIANPKIVLFFTAVLPPFLDLQRPLQPQLMLFAVATIGLDAAAMSAYGLGGAQFATRMADRRFRRGFAFVIAGLLAGAAALIALSGQSG